MLQLDNLDPRQRRASTFSRQSHVRSIELASAFRGRLKPSLVSTVALTHSRGTQLTDSICYSTASQGMARTREAGGSKHVQLISSGSCHLSSTSSSIHSDSRSFCRRGSRSRARYFEKVLHASVHEFTPSIMGLWLTGSVRSGCLRPAPRHQAVV